MTVTSSVSTIALRTFPIFQGLGDDRLAAVARCAMMRRVPRETLGEHLAECRAVMEGERRRAVEAEVAREG